MASWVRCPCCHRKFSGRSLAFHVAACVRKHMVSTDTVSCPLCREQVRAGVFKCHLDEQCLYRHLGEGGGPSHDTSSGSSGSGAERMPLSSMGNTAHSEECADVELVACQYCARKFAKGTRLDTHMVICKKTANTPKRERYDSSKKRRGHNQLYGGPSMGSSSGGSMVLGGSSYSSSKAGRRSLRAPASISSEAHFHRPARTRVTIGESNESSFGNPLNRVVSRGPRPTYSHY